MKKTRKQHIDTSLYKRKGMKKFLGIYSLTRTEAVKADENRPNIKIGHGLLKKLLLLNPYIITNFLRVNRKQHTIYNLAYLLMLENIVSVSLNKKQYLIGYYKKTIKNNHSGVVVHLLIFICFLIIFYNSLTLKDLENNEN